MFYLKIISDLSRDVTPVIDIDSSDYEDDEELDDDDDLKGVDLTADYAPQTTRREELIKLAHLFPELDEIKDPSSKFKKAVFAARKSKKIFWSVR